MTTTKEDRLRDPAAERAVLGGIFRYGQEAYLDVADILQVDSFTDKSNQALYTCAQHLIDQQGMTNLDDASLFSAASSLGFDWLFKDTTETRYVKSILNTNVRLDNVRKWAAKVRKLHIARLLNEQLDAARDELVSVKGDESVDFILGLVENRIFDFSTLLQGSNNDKPSRLGEGLRDYIQHLRENPVEMVGISSGYGLYDMAIGGGFRRKTVNLVGARTGIGKGQFAINVTLHVAGRNQIPVLYIDTEMGKEDHWNRTVANISKVPIHNIETGKFSTNTIQDQAIDKAMSWLEDIPYTYINVAGKPFEEIVSIMRRWVYTTVGHNDAGKTNDCLVIYDYIKLMNADDIHANLQEYQILGFQMTSLHNFSVRHDLPILSFIQLNKDGIDKETTAVVSGSDRVTWLASNLCIFKPKTADEIDQDGGEDAGNRKLVPLKTRHGGGLAYNDYISMNLRGEIALLDEIDTHHNIQRKRNSNVSDRNASNIVDVDEVPFGVDDEYGSYNDSAAEEDE